MSVKRSRWSWLAVVLLAGTIEAAAQPTEPIGPFVADVRGTLARFKADAAVAQIVNVNADTLPTRGLGIAVGAHLYPFRRGRVVFGIGGELLVARGSRTAEQSGMAGVQARTVTTHVSALSPQVSLNFGRGDGWSYISGGIGSARLTAERAELPLAEGVARTRATNYGAGARWFTRPHVAFTFDVRFHTINARAAAGVLPAHPRTRFMVISVGASLR